MKKTNNKSTSKNKNKKVEKIQTKKESKKIDNIVTNDTNEYKKIFKYLIIILIILILVYLLTVWITNNSSSSTSSTVATAEIQHSKILSGTVFDKKDSSYYVLFYNTKDSDSSVYSDAYSTYHEKKDSLAIYYVDLDERLNSSIVSDSSNKEATNSSELKINGATLIKIVDGKIDQYIEGSEDITSTLNS